MNSSAFENFSEEAQEALDFARCQRRDGSFYGTSGQCRKGSPAGAKQKAPKKAKAKPKAKAQPKAKAEPKPKKAAPKKAAPKKEAPAAERKEGSYKPREAKGKTGAKATREKLEFGIDAFDPQALDKRIADAKAEKGRAKKEKEKIVKNLEIRRAQAEKNKQFLEELERNTPEGTKLKVDEYGGIEMTSKTPSGDSVKTGFSVSNGYAFEVNDTLNAGTVKDRRAQLEVATQVRNQYDAIVRSLPTGTVIETSAYTGDGKAAGRTKAYERVGFSKPTKAGMSMFAVKQADGTMAPGTPGPKGSKEWTNQRANPDAMWFAEGDKKRVIEEIKTFYAAIFGGPATEEKK